MLYLNTCQPIGIISINAIVGVPMPGPYYIYNCFSHTHPLKYVKI